MPREPPRAAGRTGSHVGRPWGAKAAGTAAARLIGAQAHVAGASRSGRPALASADGSLGFSCGARADDGASWIDIDLVPAGPTLALDLVLTAERPEALAALVERGLVGVFDDGRELMPEPAPPLSVPPVSVPPSAATGAAGPGNGNGNGQGAVANPDFVTASVGKPVVANLLANDNAASTNSPQITHVNGEPISVGGR